MALDVPLESPREQPQRHQIVRSAALLIAGSSVAQAMMALALLLVVRRLGAQDYGQYAGSFAACSVSGVLVSFGLDTWLLREGARRPGDLPASLAQVVSLKLALALPWLLVIGLALPALAPESFPRALALTAAAATLADALLSAFQAAFKSQLRNAATTQSLLLSRGLVLAGTVALVLYGGHAAVPYGLVRLAGIAVAVVVATLGSRFAWRSARPRALVAMARGSAAMALNDVLSIIYAQADIVIVAVLLGAQATGLYSPASTLVNALFVVPMAAYSVATPVFVRHLAAGGGQLKGAFLRAMPAFVVIGLGLALAVGLSARAVVPRLLGPGYVASAPVLQILSPILLLKAVSFAFASLLVAINWQGRRAGVQALSVTTNVGLNLLLAAGLGINAVAWNYVASEVVVVIGYGVLVGRWWRQGDRLPAEATA